VTPEIHVDLNPRHLAMTFEHTNGQPILKRGPHGWVLRVSDGREWVLDTQMSVVIERATELVRGIYCHD
jgi:hypothetical protein